MKLLIPSLAVLLLSGCSTPNPGKLMDKVKEAVTTTTQSTADGVANLPETSAPYFGWIAGFGAVCVIFGMIIMILSSIPSLPIKASAGFAWTCILTGAAGVFAGFAIPRYSFLIEAHLAEYAVYYAATLMLVTLYGASLHMVAKIRYQSGYNLGFEHGKDSV